MHRKKATFLVTAALLGVAATVALIALVLGGGEPRARQAKVIRRPGESLPTRDGSGTGGGNGAVVIQREPRRAPGSTVPPGERIPSDSEETRRMRREASSRVVEILEGIFEEKDRFKRWQLNEELKKLLRTLGNDVSPNVRLRLLEMLQTVDPQWAALVGDALGSMRGDIKTAEALIAMLEGEDRTKNAYRRNAIYAALGKMRVRAVAPKLLSMLGQGHNDEAKIVQTLGLIGGPAEVTALFDKLDEPLQTNTRREIEKVLRTKARTPGLMDKVAGALAEADAGARPSLVRVLAASKQPSHAQKVRELLASESDEATRKAAIEALGRFGDKESGLALLDLVQHAPGKEAQRAVQAVHRIKNPQTVDALADGWEGLDKDGRLAVIGAASRLPLPTDKLNGLARDEGLHDESMRVRTASARTLGRPGRDENVDGLVNYMGQAKRPSEVSAAVTALHQIGTKKAAEEA
ncbi:MAG: HEAT repeat domain-containing protein, partial [Planctomycetota bacterium]